MADMNLSVQVKGIKQGMNVNDVKVPVKLRERRLTGLSWFDDAFGGEGLVPSTLHMISGMPGAGKSTLARQLGNSITKSGHICIGNSGEESPYQVAMACERLNFKHGFLVGQETMVPELLNYADNVRKAHPTKQLFLLQDSLQTFDDGKYVDKFGNSRGTNGSTPVRATEMLTKYCKDTYTICLFIAQCTKNGDFAGKNTVLHAVDGRGHLYFDEDKKSETWGKRLFEVSKNRWGCNGKTFIVGMGKEGLYEEGNFEKAKMGG